MRVARYARYSSDNQRSESIDEQFREIDEWCERNSHTVVASFSDYALSGKFDYRPEFENMIEQSSLGLWDGVVVFDSSRFSRGGEYGIIDSLRLSEVGVVLLSVRETFGNDFAGKLMKHLKFLMNEEKLDELSANVKRGKRETALQHKHNGGTPPLGYDLDKEGYLRINEYEAEAVRLIFNMFAKRRTYNEICDELNKRGYKTKRNGNKFGKTSLHAILGNKKYIGIYEYGKITREKLRQKSAADKKSKIIQNVEYIEIEGGCPAIIENNLWEQVQIMRRDNMQFNPRAKVEYKLKHKIICGKCGSFYNGTLSKTSHFYVCQKKKAKKTCDNRGINKDTIEKAVKKQVLDNLFSDAGKRAISTFIHQFNERRKNVGLSTMKAYNKKVSTLDSRLMRAKEAYLSGDIELTDFRQAKNDVEYQKSKLVKPINEMALESDIPNLLSKLEKRVMSDDELIYSLVEKVVVTDDNIEIFIDKQILFNTPNGSSIPVFGGDEGGYAKKQDGDSILSSSCKHTGGGDGGI